ncbi:MAG: tetratricopeptide repeat protein [Treponema sp.]|nr:tetratricopeptide repeat protein [Treponema sp.]
METAVALNNSAVALTEANQPFEAIPLFREALILEPENPLLWLNLGIAQQKTGEYAEAIESFRHCLIINEDLCEAWQSLGLIHYELKEFDLAQEYYLSALDRNDNDPKTWNNLGVLYFNTNNFTEARNCFEKSVSLFPQYYDALFNLRDACRELGDFRAAAEFERVLCGFDAFNGRNNS